MSLPQLNVLAVAAALLLAPAQKEKDKPAALRAFEESRRGLTGDIEWTVTGAQTNGRTLHYVSRYARNGDMMFEFRGDDEGWTGVRPGNSRFPQLYLINADGYWHHQETQPRVRYGRPEGDVPDFVEFIRDLRWVGVSPNTDSMEYGRGFSVLYARQERNPLLSWEQEKVGGIYRVKATFEAGNQVEWRINPEKGWNAESIRVLGTDGRVRWTVTSELRQYADTWFPETVRYVSHDAGKTLATVRLTRAAIGDAHAAASFDAKDLGLEPGANVSPANFGMEVGKPPVWNGDAISSWDAWLADVKAGRRDWGPTIKRLIRGVPFHEISPYVTADDEARGRIAEKRMAQQSKVSRHVGLWERYVRQFVERYQLNPEQTSKAYQILASCERHANSLLARHRAEMTRVLSEIDQARSDDDRAEVERLEARFEQMTQPVHEIFENDLKPRLETLPTRAQRKAAGEGGSDEDKADSGG